MACEEDVKRCYTFIWKLENVSYCWKKPEDIISSPLFTVDEIHETNWKLELRYLENSIELLLRRCQDRGPEKVKIEFELAFLTSEGTGLRVSQDNKIFEKTAGYGCFTTKDAAFFARRSDFFPQDTLTARCRMWKTAGEISKEVQCFARTRVVVEKISFLWNIEKFSYINSSSKRTYEIKSLGRGEQLMWLELFSTGGLILENTVRFKIIPNFQNMKFFTFQMSIVDASKNYVQCFQDKGGYGDLSYSKVFTLFYSKTEFLEKKTEYFPNDVLSLWCDCAFSVGTTVEEIEKSVSGSTTIEKKEKNCSIADKENVLPLPTSILIDDFKSLLNNGILSDTKLITNSQTYPAHKSILSIRSPVFRAMFSSDMKEKTDDCVDIEDLSDDAVFRMLRYIYSGEIEELSWISTTELYQAADKYQILSLKDICSTYLKNNLALNKACEALVFSDLHQDDDLKSVVQKFILEHGKNIINSEEWRQLMETNLKLAAETMCLKFKE